MNLLTKQKDYRSILKQELERRCGRNPHYSLRSFARDLGMAPARLSDVLRGRYGLSRFAAESIGLQLGWSRGECSYFCDLVDSEHARSRSKKVAARCRLQEEHEPLAHQQLTLDAFQIISDWYHYALLELALTKDFQSNSAWIARQLGISEHMVIAAIERMKRLELIEELEGGRLQPKDNFTVSPSGIPSEAIRKFHRQILEKALLAIDLQSVDERDLSSLVLAIRKDELPRAKESLKTFRRQFNADFGKSQEKDEVYCLAIQFFRLQETNK